MDLINVELIENRFKLIAGKESSIIKSLTSDDFDILINSSSKYIQNPEIHAFISAIQFLLEQEQAELQNGEVIVKNNVLCSLEKEDSQYLKLPLACNYKVEIREKGNPGGKSFAFDYSLFDNHREIVYQRVGCLLKVGSRVHLLSKFHYELFETLDEFANLSPEEKTGITPWQDIVKCKELSDSIDIVLSKFLENQNIIIPGQMSFEIIENKDSSFTLKPILKGLDDENQQKFQEQYNDFSNAQNSYVYELNDGKKVRLIIPNEIKENLQMMRQRTKIRSTKEKNLLFNSPHAFFKYPEVVSQEDFSDRVIGFGLYKEIAVPRTSSELNWKYPVIICVVNISGVTVDIQFNDKEEVKSLKEDIKQALADEQPYIIYEGHTIPLSAINLDEFTKVFDIATDEIKPKSPPRDKKISFKTKDDEIVKIDRDDKSLAETIKSKLLEALNIKSNNPLETPIIEIPVLKENADGVSEPANAEIPITGENLKSFRKFLEIHLLIDEETDKLFNKTEQELKFAENSKNITAEVPYSLKKEFTTKYGEIEKFELKKHQHQGLAWLQNSYRLRRVGKRGMQGVLLADDMGLGKTLQILAFIAWLYETAKLENFEQDGLYKPILIIAPVILLQNWKDEYNKFFKGTLGEPLILHGDTLKGFRLKDKNTEWLGREFYQVENEDGKPKSYLNVDKIKEHKLIITNYDTIVNYEFSLGKIDWSVIVLDEAQEIKEGKSYKSRIAKALKADFKIACTGTPIENSLTDLWNIFDFLQQGLLGTLKQFTAIYNKKNMTPELYKDLQNQFYYEKPYSYILRRTKTSELSDSLPQKSSITYTIPLTDEQLNLYDDFRKEMIKNPKSSLSVLHEINKLHQHPRLVSVDNYKKNEPKSLISECPKFIKLIEILKEIKEKKEKAIIFCIFHQLQSYLKQVLVNEFNFNIEIINGDDSGKGNASRQNTIDKFQKDKDKFNILILSPRAAGVGLNIAGANHVIHYGRWWNPAKEMQATDRAYRIGQKKDVMVYYLINKDPKNKFKTFDETLHELLMSRIELANNFLEVSNIDLDGILIKQMTEEAYNLKQTPTNNKTVIDFKKVKLLDHDQFEAFVSCIYDEMGYTSILCPNCFPGVDVIAFNDNEIRLIQCKHSNFGCIKDSSAIDNVLDGRDRLINKLNPNKKIILSCITNTEFDRDAVKAAKYSGIELLTEKFFNQFKINEATLILKNLDRKKHFSEVYSILQGI